MGNYWSDNTLDIPQYDDVVISELTKQNRDRLLKEIQLNKPVLFKVNKKRNKRKFTIDNSTKKTQENNIWDYNMLNA